MATKPVSAFSWATTTLYTAGPAIGLVTKVAPIGTEGFVPGNETRPEIINFAMNNIGDEWLTGWLLLGSSAAGLDAHLMETDASGFNSTASMTLGGTAAAAFSLNVTENSGATGAAISATNTSTGRAINATGGGAGTLSPITSTCTGTAAAVFGTNVGGGGAGVSGLGNGAAPGVTGTGGTTGNGVEGNGGATGGHGVEGSCTIASFAGIHGESAPAISGTYGVFGETLRFDNAGVFGLNNLAGGDPLNGFHSGVVGSALDSTGVFGQSTGGYGVWAESDPTSPNRAALHIATQDAQATLSLVGDIAMRDDKDTMEVRKSAAWNIVHETPHGFVFQRSVSASGFLNSATFTTQTTAAFAVPDAPKEIGTIIVRLTCSIRNATANLNTIEVRVRDVTAGAVIAATEIFCAQTNSAVTVAGARANSFEKCVALSGQYVLPLAGARSFDVQIATHGTLGVDYADMVLTIEGVY